MSEGEARKEGGRKGGRAGMEQEASETFTKEVLQESGEVDS